MVFVPLVDMDKEHGGGAARSIGKEHNFLPGEVN
jgi:hypothetical protein